MSEANNTAAVTEERWPKRWHCVEARDNEYAEQSGPGKPIMAVRNGVNIGTVDICPKCFETFDHHAAKPEQAPFEPGQRVRTNDGRVLDVSRCEKRHVPGKLRWVVDDLNGERAFADDCELFYGVKPEVRYACSKVAAVRDRVKWVGIKNSLIVTVDFVYPNGDIGWSYDGVTSGRSHASFFEFVPEVTPKRAETDHIVEANKLVEPATNKPRDFPLDPVCELELEQTRQRLAVAMSLLGQCDNRLFLVGDFEIRKTAGGWKLCHPSYGALVGNELKATVFTDPVQAAQRAIELSAVKAQELSQGD